MLKNILPSLKLTLLLIIVFAVVYPLFIWGIAQVAPGKGKGFTIEKNGKTIGYENIAQKFTDDKYFWARPSATGHNAAGSGGSNKSPYNPEYVVATRALLDTFLKHNPGIKKEDVPAEMITASGSGIDPDITVQGALVQVKRVAAARHISEDKLKELIDKQTEKPVLGMFGIERVNVLKLNLALDDLK